MLFLKKILILVILVSVCIFSQDPHIISVKTKTKNLPFGFKTLVPEYSPNVALALSGGGARGFAQLGVLKAFEQNNIPVDIIVGTSMGSVIGGLYSAGYSLRQIDSIAKNTDWDELLVQVRETDRRQLFVDQKITEDKAIFALRLKGFTPVIPTSINDGQRLSNYLNLLTFQAPIHVKKNFDDLEYKFRAVCTDLVTGNPVVISDGSLSQAMRASSSVSFFLSPVRMDSLILVDGGLVANVPVRIASNSGGDFIIAVNTTSNLHSEDELEVPWMIADQIVSIPMKLLNEVQLNNADISINPDLSGKEADDFTEIDKLIDKGYESTLPYLQKIDQDIDSIFKSNLAAGQKEFFIKDFYIENINSVQYPSLYSLRHKDSLSNYEIIRAMCGLLAEGDYKNIKAEISDDAGNTKLNFIIEKKPVVRKVDLEGITLINKEKAEFVFSPLLGTPFNSKRIVSKIIQLLGLYRDQGYSLADLEEHSFDTSGVLHLKIDEGLISKIDIEGNTFTAQNVIRREFPLVKGDYFNYDAVSEGLMNLRSTNLFDDIILSVEKRNRQNIVVITVLEKISSLVRFGFRIDNENKAQFSIDLRDENFFGSGTEFGLLLFGGTRNRSYIFEHKSNRVFNTYLTYKINAFYQFDDAFNYIDDPPESDNDFSRSPVGEYRQIYYGASLAIGSQVGRFGNLIFKGTYKFDQLKNKQGSTVEPFKYKIFSLKASSTIDTQDKYPFPQKGFYFSGFYETAQTALGSDIGFFNLGFNYKSYFSINNEHTFSPRVRAGFADKTLPLTEQYSLGGQEMFYGMREDEYRGRQIFVTSLEYRYNLHFEIFFDTYFSLRYDLGSVWEEQEQIRFKDLKHGIGTSLSFDTPIGPAEFSVGKSFLFKKDLPNNPVSWGDTFFYFSIGYFY